MCIATANRDPSKLIRINGYGSTKARSGSITYSSNSKNINAALDIKTYMINYEYRCQITFSHHGGVVGGHSDCRPDPDLELAAELNDKRNWKTNKRKMHKKKYWSL